MSRIPVRNSYYPGYQQSQRVHTTQPPGFQQHFHGPTVNIRNVFENPGAYEFNVRFPRSATSGNVSPAHHGVPSITIQKASPVAGNGNGSRAHQLNVPASPASGNGHGNAGGK